MDKTPKKFSTKLMALALSVAMLGMGAGAVLALQNDATATAEGTLTALSAQGATSADLESPFKSVYDEVSKSTVGVKINLQRRSTQGRIVSDSTFVGSGVVISDEGHIVTNYHVVTAGGTQVYEDLTVVYDGQEYTATYIAGDEENDIAVLKAEGLDAPAAKLGNSDELSVGDWALVVGNPLGENFTNTLTVGVISGLNRNMTRVNGGTAMIQTDAAINSGNSGGGLFNIRGELVGITSSKMSSSGYFGTASIEGMGLAIPINTVSRIADDLINYGKVIYPRMGIGIDTLTSPSDEPTSEYLPSSVWVTKVEDGTPAEEAGLKVDDLIISADGQRVKSTEELQAVVRSHSVGETVELEVYRIPNLRSVKLDEDIPEGEYLTFTIELQNLDAE